MEKLLVKVCMIADLSWAPIQSVSPHLSVNASIFRRGNLKRGAAPMIKLDAQASNLMRSLVVDECTDIHLDAQQMLSLCCTNGCL